MSVMLLALGQISDWQGAGWGGEVNKKRTKMKKLMQKVKEKEQKKIDRRTESTQIFQVHIEEALVKYVRLQGRGS